MDLLNKGKKFLSSEEGKEFTEDAKEAYSTFNKTEGTTTDKAKAAYSTYQEALKDNKKDDKKEEKK